MRSRGLVLTVLMILTALLAACGPLPGVLAPTAAPFTAIPPTAEPAATSASAATTSPLPTPEVQPTAAAPDHPDSQRADYANSRHHRHDFGRAGHR